MKSNLSNALLAVIAICLLKLSFYDEIDSKNANQLKVDSNSLVLSDALNPENTFVWTPYRNGNYIPLKVYCVNC